MFRILLSHLVFLLSLPALAVACDPTITLEVQRPFGSEAEPTVVYAKATSGCPVTLVRVYVDNKRIYDQRGADPINARLIMGRGFHHVVVQAWNTAGAIARQDRYVTSTGDPTEPISGCEYGEGLFWGGDHVPYNVKSPIYMGFGGSSSSGPFTSIRLYIDGVYRAQTYGTTGRCLPANFLPLKPGLHFINLEAWDPAGFIYLSGSMVQVIP